MFSEFKLKLSIRNNVTGIIQYIFCGVFGHPQSAHVYNCRLQREKTKYINKILKINSAPVSNPNPVYQTPVNTTTQKSLRVYRLVEGTFQL